MKLNPQMLATNALTTVGLVLALAFSASAQIPKLNSYPKASATVFLDFDGHTVRGTSWNWDGTIRAKPSGLTSPRINEIFNRVAEDFRIFNLNITTDSTVFKKAPSGKRMRVIFTPTSEWYGKAAGVSFINSFTWGDDTPAWVFSTLLEGNVKFISEAASHEVGHTLGLQHQSIYDKNCHLLSEYYEGKGTGEIAWAPIMGVGYYRNVSVWTIGTSIEGCHVMQNDINIISRGLNNIGLRADEHGNTRATATTLSISKKHFQSTGVINTANDRDVFRIVISQRSNLKASAIPNHVAAKNSGANVDLYLTLLTNTGDTIGRYNPKTILNASLDTMLLPGTYFLAVDGIGNQFMDDYGSVGMYSISGSVDNPGAKPAVLVKGNIRDDYNVIKWEVGGTLPRTTYVEYSVDGGNYTSVPVATSTFIHHAPRKGKVRYRVKMVMEDETVEYSNEITLDGVDELPVSIGTNLVKSSVQVQSKGEYAYQLIDAMGRVLSKGKITTGMNDVPLSTITPGILILRIFNQTDQFHFRLIKQ